MTLYAKTHMSRATRNYARAMSISLLIASLALADPPDAPRTVALEPQVLTHDEQVACLTCESDLAEARAGDKVSFKWVVVAAGLGLLAGAAIGAGVAAATRK